ncbi:uncharacterized protein [Rutidosis leptorrhynchoides]|uniref:uncharacterized protein n=1 Tax=Rutidosis leptorrhynchoides TaxID=125765 RepID=UPI003A9A21F7
MAQKDIDNDPYDHQLRVYAAVLLQEYEDAKRDELSILQQQAKIRWLTDGDKSTSYFHGILRSRKHKSMVESICDEHGTRLYGDEVAQQFVNHFQNFLGSTDNVISLNEVGDIFTNKLSRSVADKMVMEVTDNEIKDAMFSIDSTKAAGPDGYSSHFSRKHGNWLIVSINQSAFVPGRHIQDNILVTQELLKCYNRASGPQRCALKIDLQKAYDTVNWSFLEMALKGFGFHPLIIKWIMAGVTTARFSICVNEVAHGYFKSGRGLRQGDPISPYLFTIVMEVLNLILVKEIRNSKEFQFHFGCKRLKLSHVGFADDLLVLCHGDLNSVKVVKKALDVFSSVSGLGVIDCKGLVDKVRAKVGSWRNKKLSYAGRLQLIASVLSSMQIYWASVYMLPCCVIAEIEKVLKSFL